jgi:hypothetical protein
MVREILSFKCQKPQDRREESHSVGIADLCCAEPFPSPHAGFIRPAYFSRSGPLQKVRLRYKSINAREPDNA